MPLLISAQTIRLVNVGKLGRLFEANVEALRDMINMSN